jgi:hypothetical protein
MVTSLVIPRCLRAQQCIGCEEDTVPRRTLILPALGARFGVPEKVSGAIGLVAGYEWRSNGHLHTRDFALFVEPGVGASRASLVYMAASNFGSGLGIGATVLRTMDDTWTHGTNAFAFPRRGARVADISGGTADRCVSPAEQRPGRRPLVHQRRLWVRALTLLRSGA